MSDKSFLLVSLKESQSKKLAQVISNDSCRKILDFLANNEGKTETEISKKLNIPLSTVHYNLQHLLESKLVEADEFHYSEKGKEVLHFKLSNKYIIIAPREDASVMDKLKKFLPAIGIIAAISAGMHIITRFFSSAGSFTVQKASFAATRVGEMAADSVMADAAAPSAEVVTTVTQTPWFHTHFALWFLYGGLFVILLFFIWELIKSKK